MAPAVALLRFDPAVTAISTSLGSGQMPSDSSSVAENGRLFSATGGPQLTWDIVRKAHSDRLFSSPRRFTAPAKRPNARIPTRYAKIVSHKLAAADLGRFFSGVSDLI